MLGLDVVLKVLPRLGAVVALVTQVLMPLRVDGGDVTAEGLEAATGVGTLRAPENREKPNNF